MINYEIIKPDTRLVLNHLHINHKPNPNGAGYIIAQCPFHGGGNEKNFSFNIHADAGNFRCFACGIKGSDVLALYMQLTGASFPEALRHWRAQ